MGYPAVFRRVDTLQHQSVGYIRRKTINALLYEQRCTSWDTDSNLDNLKRYRMRSWIPWHHLLPSEQVGALLLHCCCSAAGLLKKENLVGCHMGATWRSHDRHKNAEQSAVKLLLSQGVPEGHKERSPPGADRRHIGRELLGGLLREATGPRNHGAVSALLATLCSSSRGMSTAGILCLCGKPSVSAAVTESRLRTCFGPFCS